MVISVLNGRNGVKTIMKCWQRTSKGKIKLIIGYLRNFKERKMACRPEQFRQANVPRRGQLRK